MKNIPAVAFRFGRAKGSVPRAVLLAVLPLLCLVWTAVAAAPEKAEKAGAESVVGISLFPAVYESKGGKQIGSLEGVYSPAPEAYPLLGREGGWLRIRFAGGPAWVRAADALPVDELLRGRPYRKPLLCPDGLPGDFALGSPDAPLRLGVERVATLAGGRGIMRLTDKDGKILWQSGPEDGLIACVPGQAAWPMAAGDLDGDGRPEILIAENQPAAPPLLVTPLRWTGTAMEKTESFYVWQSGAEIPEIWAAKDAPFEGDGEKMPPVYRYVSELYPPYFDGSFAALVVQENRDGGAAKPVTTRGVGLFRLRPDSRALVLRQWIIPLR